MTPGTSPGHRLLRPGQAEGDRQGRAVIWVNNYGKGRVYEQRPGPRRRGHVRPQLPDLAPPGGDLGGDGQGRSSGQSAVGSGQLGSRQWAVGRVAGQRRDESPACPGSARASSRSRALSGMLRFAPRSPGHSQLRDVRSRSHVMSVRPVRRERDLPWLDCTGRLPQCRRAFLLTIVFALLAASIRSSRRRSGGEGPAAAAKPSTSTR